jgi:two-component system response regulator HydG
MKKGACDYLNTPTFTPAQKRVGRLTSNARLQNHRHKLEGEMMNAFQFEGMIGRSRPMLDLFRTIKRVAAHFRTILLTGETGSGKELAARALHRLGPRPAGPFIACNCAGWAETLVETELFGCVKGAFTGATTDRKGVFEFANGGTLMLDEIAELPLSSQAKLLRVLQNQEIQRVGSPVTHRVDVRIIAATSRNLQLMLADKELREDLYYRLSMIEIHVPRLVDRLEDLPLLEQQMVRSFAEQSKKQIRGLTHRAHAVLSRYGWPGNVRELENVICHGCIMAEGDFIDVHHLPGHISRGQDSGVVDVRMTAMVSLKEMQWRYAREVVNRIKNKVQAAKLLGISRNKLYRLLSEEMNRRKRRAPSYEQDGSSCEPRYVSPKKS